MRPVIVPSPEKVLKMRPKIVEMRPIIVLSPEKALEMRPKIVLSPEKPSRCAL